MTAKGQLQHHFWGTYCASIALVFASDTDAATAHATAFPAWTIGRKHPNVLVWHGGDPELKATITTLVRHGADRRAIDSVAHSIDYGDPFTITI